MQGIRRSGVRMIVATIIVLSLILAVVPVSAQQQTYVVQPGDTLQRIADLFNTTVQAIRITNGIAGDYLEVGEVLLIPAQGGPSATTFEFYTVRAGDTLSSIADLYGTTVQAIQRQNSTLVSGVRIFPGTTLQIPVFEGGGGVEPVIMQQTVQPQSVTPPAANFVYTVRAGDQLRFIAPRYGTTWQAIAELNNLQDPNLIFTGQQLLIPNLGIGGPVTAVQPVQSAAPAVIIASANPYAASPQPINPVLTAGRYIVQPGDTMLMIARAFNVDAFSIARANGIFNLNHIFAGQRLFIPGRSY